MLNLDQPKVHAKAEIGFLKFLIVPLWTLLGHIYPNSETKKLLEYLDDNITRYEKIRDGVENKDEKLE